MLCCIYLVMAVTPINAAPRIPGVQKGRISQPHPWFFGLRFVLLIVAWDGYHVPVGFRIILPKRHTAYRTENALFRGMVGEFAPPRWAKLVVVGGDSAYGSKDIMRMVQDRDKAALSRRWGFVFAIARTWKMVEKKTIKQLVTHVPRQYYQCTRVPSEHTGRGLQDLLDVSGIHLIRDTLLPQLLAARA
jgi:hypothetical protein